MLIISHYSRVNSPVEAQANRDMTGAVIEYARGLAVVKSFGKTGASMESVTNAVRGSKKIRLKIEWGIYSGKCSAPACTQMRQRWSCDGGGTAMYARRYEFFHDADVRFLLFQYFREP